MPESYTVKKMMQKILKIFQVQPSAAQHKNAEENDSFFVLHVDLSGWAPGNN